MSNWATRNSLHVGWRLRGLTVTATAIATSVTVIASSLLPVLDESLLLWDSIVCIKLFKASLSTRLYLTLLVLVPHLPRPFPPSLHNKRYLELVLSSFPWVFPGPWPGSHRCVLCRGRCGGGSGRRCLCGSGLTVIVIFVAFANTAIIIATDIDITTTILIVATAIGIGIRVIAIASIIAIVIAIPVIVIDITVIAIASVSARAKASVIGKVVVTTAQVGGGLAGLIIKFNN